LALTKTGIEYLDFVWNFYPGCNHWKTGVCPVGERCWARGTATRFKGGDFEPHLLPEKLLDPLKGKQGGRRIGVCFTGDLFGDWVDPEQKIGKQVEMWKLIEHRGWIAKPDNPLKRIVLEVIKLCHQDTFIFLTKNPAGLLKWEKFPDNAWVGASVCDQKMLTVAIEYLALMDAKVKFISFEPVMKSMGCVDTIWQELYLGGINWVVIGGWSGGRNTPEIGWIGAIVGAADFLGIPVFLKDNLLPLLKNHNAYPWAFTPNSVPTFPTYRQEYPTK
jgi:protein gp37